MIEKLVKNIMLVTYLAWIEGVAIFAAVFVVSGVGSWNDYKKDE